MTLNKTEQNIGAIISLLAITVVLVYLTLPMVEMGDEVVVLGTMLGILLFSGILCAMVIRKYRKAHAPAMIDYLNVGVQRYILALLMMLYGIDKLLGNFFDYQLFALDSRLAEASEFELSWFFYGKNRWQELFAGIMEFVPGIFLFGRRTWYVAAIILLPVTAQVFLLNLFFKIGGITFPVAAILLSCNMYIIYSQKEKILQFFRSLNFNAVPALTGSARTAVRTLKGIGFFLAFAIVFIKVRPVIFRSPAQHRYQALVGVYALREMKKNNVACSAETDSLCYKDLYIEKQSRWNVLRRANGRTEAFVLRMNNRNDSVTLYVNKGGTGDGRDILDSATALKGVLAQAGERITIKGIQAGTPLELAYERQARVQPKKWFW